MDVTPIVPHASRAGQKERGQGKPRPRVLRDPYSLKPYVLFYTTKRVGGGVQNFDAIKVMKFSAS